jgi:Fic family protein
MHHTLLPRIYDAGQYRAVEVHIAGAIITPPEPHQVGWLMREALDDLRAVLDASPDDSEKRAAIVKFFHRFNAIHPFRDGNGRVSRAVLHLLLRQQGLLATRNDFYDVFALCRDEYHDAMKEGDRGDLFYLQFFIRRGMLDARLKDLLDSLRETNILSAISPEQRDWLDPVVRGAYSSDEYLDRGIEFFNALPTL